MSSFLELWQDYTKPLATSDLFRLWSGITLISGVLGRKVWVVTNPRMPRCFPNLFTMLVGDPGLGKDIAINTALDLLDKANTHHQSGPLVRIGGESISRKGLIDKLSQDQSRVSFSLNGRSHTYHSLMFCIGELGTAIPDYDPKLIPLLNDLYNNKPQYEDTIRGLEVSVARPHIVLLAGNQPTTLADVFPERTFRMGLTARFLFIYEKERETSPFFVSEEEQRTWDPDLEDRLIGGLLRISRLSGEFQVDPEVREAVNDFKEERPGEVPGSRFQDYNTRRPLHAMKIAICLCAAEYDNRVVNIDHWYETRRLMSQYEARLPEMFENVVSAFGFSEHRETLKGMGDRNKTVTHRDLITRFSRVMNAQSVNFLINISIQEGLLTPLLDSEGKPRKPPVYKIDPR